MLLLAHQSQPKWHLIRHLIVKIVFYGITFSLLGIVLLISCNDLRRYYPIMNAAFAVLFAAGIARVAAWIINGAPSPIIIGILCADLLLPPVLYFWLKHNLKSLDSYPNT